MRDSLSTLITLFSSVFWQGLHYERTGRVFYPRAERRKGSSMWGRTDLLGKLEITVEFALGRLGCHRVMQEETAADGRHQKGPGEPHFAPVSAILAHTETRAVPTPDRAPCSAHTVSPPPPLPSRVVAAGGSGELPPRSCNRGQCEAMLLYKPRTIAEIR